MLPEPTDWGLLRVLQAVGVYTAPRNPRGELRRLQSFALPMIHRRHLQQLEMEPLSPHHSHQFEPPAAMNSM